MFSSASSSHSASPAKNPTKKVNEKSMLRDSHGEKREQLCHIKSWPDSSRVGAHECETDGITMALLRTH